MMGQQPPLQSTLFCQFDLGRRIPAEHPLRAIAAAIDFEFVSDEVAESYSDVGQPSVPPPVILKLMFLLAFENVRSERALFAMLPLRLDWLWFLGMDLDSKIPTHSVLSKARKRWQVTPFRTFFERIIWQAQQAGLIDGSRIFCDGSLFDSNASRKSVLTVGVSDLSQLSDELERRLDEEPSDEAVAKAAPVRRQRRSSTDPDAAVVTKPNAGSARPRYKSHRAIDDRHGVITATTVTPGDGDEAQQLEGLIDQHESHTESAVCTVVADTQYGTTDNLLMCHDRGITPRIPSPVLRNEAQLEARGFYSRRNFEYAPATNTYLCPAGQTLRQTQVRADKDGVRYQTRKGVCPACPLQSFCTDSERRSITRHVRQHEIDQIHQCLNTEPARRDLRRRKHFMERSFAVAVRYGLKKCRWRRSWRAEIHELLIATIQNIVTVVRYATDSPRAVMAGAQALTRLALQPADTHRLGHRLPRVPIADRPWATPAKSRSRLVGAVTNCALGHGARPIAKIQGFGNTPVRAGLERARFS